MSTSTKGRTVYSGRELICVDGRCDTLCNGLGVFYAHVWIDIALIHVKRRPKQKARKHKVRENLKKIFEPPKIFACFTCVLSNNRRQRAKSNIIELFNQENIRLLNCHRDQRPLQEEGELDHSVQSRYTVVLTLVSSLRLGSTWL